MLLMDKGYYDYDFKPIEKVKADVKKSAKKNEVRMVDFDQDKLERRMADFGMGRYAKKEIKGLTDAEFQAHAIKDLENNGRG